MGLKGKLDKVIRWGRIWCAQFGRVKKLRCEAGHNCVLIIKLDAIGDFLIWLDSAKEFRRLYSNKRLVLLCGAANRDIAEASGFFDEIKTLDIKRFETDAAFQKERICAFSGERYDLLVQTAFSRTVHMDILAGAIPAAKKVGLRADESRSNLSRYITLPFRRKQFDAVYDELFPVSEKWLMEVKRNGELIRSLGGSGFETGMPFLEEMKEQQGKVPKGDYYVIFPGASSVKKMWEICRFAKVADHIWEKTGWPGYVCGSRQEKPLFSELCGAKRTETAVVDYFGETTLLELAEVIRHAKLAVSNDTSGIHFAAAVNTPSVCILGEYNYGRFLPYDFDREYGKALSPMYVCHADMPCKRCAVGKMTGECRRCIAATGRYLCVDKIPVEQVIEAVDRLNVFDNDSVDGDNIDSVNNLNNEVNV